ncbi:MAG: hypothetical protein AB8H03_20785 [Saprospiraceae bacterium]
MKKKYLLLLFLFLVVLEVFAQPRRSIFLNTGYSFNNSLQINNIKVKNSKGYIITFGGALKLFSFKKNYLSLGIAGKTIFSSGSRNGEEFNASTIRFVFPLRMIFPLTEKWVVSTGFNFQNNLDFLDPDFRLGYRYLWRVDYSAGMKYLVTDQWSLTANADFNLRNMLDVFFINDPKIAVLIGVEKRFYNKRKAKK